MLKIQQRVWFWRVVQSWNILCQRRRFILGMMAFGIYIAMIVTGSTKPVFASRAIIRINRDQIEICVDKNVSEVICGRPQENSPVL